MYEFSIVILFNQHIEDMREYFKLGAIAAGTTAGVVIGTLLSGKKSSISETVLDKLKVGKDTLKATKESFKDAVKKVSTDKENNFEDNLSLLITKSKRKSTDVIAVLEEKIAELKHSQKTHKENRLDAKNKEQNLKEDQSSKQAEPQDVVIKAANSNPTDF